MIRFIKIIIVVSCVFISSCSKDKDDVKPTIVVHSPSNMQQINGIDTVQILATISDNSNIEWVKVSLRNSNDIPVLSSITKKPNTTDYELNVMYFFDDIHLASGQYYFDISASDGENTTTKYVDILLNETPKTRNGIFVFSNIGSQTDISLLDNNFNSSYYSSLNGDYLDAAVNSYDQQLIHTSGIIGSVSAINLKSGGLAWNVPIITSPPTPYYMGFLYDNQHIYLGKRNGIIQGYDNNGAANYGANAYPNYYMESALVHENYYLITEQHLISGSAVKLVLYWMASGIEVKQLNLNEEVKGMFSYTSNEIILITNDASSMGKLDFYSISVGLSSSPFSIGVGFIDDCVAISNGIYLVASGGDIILINANNFSTLPYMTGVGANKLKYDELTNELLVINGNLLTIYDYTSKALKGSYTHSTTILNVAFWYNK
ncbi:MAG: hypothetical protein COX70_09685 [Flavobacteriales bacterium CG_4_10_14_0_2_um_filter_32_8]|nr:MAG: hypothetical protein COX70_09685 [Flavobacteriales bacterium CG_4_10_14_0_2_um_filter_32_8]